MWEAHALISYKAAEERHWDEAEEDDEEDRPTDDSLRLWTAKRGDRGRETTRELSQEESTFDFQTRHILPDTLLKHKLDTTS